MEPFTPFSSTVVVLPTNNIDTDQIIPARFLKVTDKVGLGKNLFADWRYLPDGSENRDFVINQKSSKGAKILLAGNNFGCGSSREHAPWALVDFGFRAIISTSFADIFRNNALKNGLLPVVVSANQHRSLLELLSNDPSAEVSIDLEAQNLILPDGQKIKFEINDFSKKCLLEGLDELGYLLSLDPEIRQFEQALSVAGE
jgi:3-isopropylmalate/(R)-2-methylmalate dehydratase small subunit